MNESPLPLPVADLHCDLLGFLGVDAARSIFDVSSRCSLESLRAGGVSLQVLPVFAPGGADSVAYGQFQLRRFAELVERHPAQFRHPVGTRTPRPPRTAPPIDVLLAVENASAFVADHEPLVDGLARLDEAHRTWGPLVYVSLTWVGENRFGGGNGAQHQGLTEDGRRLLDWLVAHDIAIDLSHASDRLAHDILTWVELHGAGQARVLASHVNMRAVNDHARNLTDDVALEIPRHGGVIGLNLIAGFIGRERGIGGIVDHVAHALELGLGDALCLGADFFCETDMTDLRDRRARYFFDGFGTAACHPQLQRVLRDGLAERGHDAEALLPALCRTTLVDHLVGRGLLEAGPADYSPVNSARQVARPRASTDTLTRITR